MHHDLDAALEHDLLPTPPGRAQRAIRLGPVASERRPGLMRQVGLVGAHGVDMPRLHERPLIAASTARETAARASSSVGGRPSFTASASTVAEMLTRGQVSR